MSRLRVLGLASESGGGSRYHTDNLEFPRHAVHVIAVSALAWRLLLAVSSQQILNPDQLFQYLEQAHRLVYGYGYVPWEYRFGLRNWLLPVSLGGLLEALRVIGLDEPRSYVPAMKCVGAALSITSIYAVHAVGRNLYGMRVGLLAALLAAFWHDLARVSQAFTPEVVGMYALLPALALLTGPVSAWRAFWMGALIALAVVLRLQYAPVALVFAVAIAMMWPRALWAHVVLAGMLVLIFAGLLDWWFWGHAFVSFYVNVVMNFGFGVAETFGSQPIYYYLGALSARSLLLFPAAGLFALYHWRRHLLTIALIAAVLLPHSLISHKESRFVIFCVPLLILLVADMAWAIWGTLRDWRWLKVAQMVSVAIVLAASMVFTGGRLWLDRNRQLDLLTDLSERANVRSVLDAKTQGWDAGGYYFLHRDVPYLSLGNATPDMIENPQSYFSHVIVFTTTPVLPGYRPISSVGPSTLLELVDLSRPLLPPPADYRNRLKKGIDDRYTPHVKPWPPIAAQNQR